MTERETPTGDAVDADGTGRVSDSVAWRASVPMQGRSSNVFEASEFHVVFPADRYGKAMRVLYPGVDDPKFGVNHDDPERGLIAVITRSTGRHRISYIVHEIVPPNPDDLADGTTFQPRDGEAANSDAVYGLNFGVKYRSRAIDRAIEVSRDLGRGHRAGLLFVHTHPDHPLFGRSALPSQPDEDSARPNLRRYRDQIGRSEDGQHPPMAAGIVTTADDGTDGARPGDKEWSVRSYDYQAVAPGKHGAAPTRWADAVRIVGHSDAHPGGRVLTKYDTDRREGAVPPGPAGAKGRFKSDVMDASTALWGDANQRYLAGLRVGLVGCGGVGSVLAEQAAREGIAELVAVDFDVVDPSNRNRMQGTSQADAETETEKATHACELARDSATNPAFTARAVYGSPAEDSAEYGAVPDLLDCDVVLLAADTPGARQLTDEFAYAHCIPVIVGGAGLPPASLDPSSSVDGRPDVSLHHFADCIVSDAGPGTQCLLCEDLYDEGDDGQVENYDDHPEADPDGLDSEEDDRRDPAVMPVNNIVAGRMGLRLRSYLLGMNDRHVGRWRHFPSPGDSEWKPSDAADAVCGPDCKRPGQVALGDGQPLSTTRDSVFRSKAQRTLTD